MADTPKPTATETPPLKEAVRAARIEAAERTGVVIDMRDADVARLELLSEALDPLFAQIPDSVDLFDRGISRGETPRLWLDVVAHVAMGRDKRMYRFVQDTRYGRTTIAESYEIPALVRAITRYVASRLVERERARFSSWYEIFPRSEGATQDPTTGVWTSGTLVTAGQGIVEMLATGARSELGKIGKTLQSGTSEPSLIQRDTRRVV